MPALSTYHACRMFDDLLNANADYADGFALRGIPPVAARGFALVTCMDSRIEPLTMLGPASGRRQDPAQRAAVG